MDDAARGQALKPVLRLVVGCIALADLAKSMQGGCGVIGLLSTLDIDG